MMQTMSGCSQTDDPAAGERKEMGKGGSSFIAGVFIQARNKKLSIHEAMMRGLLTPGTALVLLEAQAASGLLTDPVRNQQLSVKAALAQGLIGRDFYEKLLSAEGAVTGYTEPYTGRRISLFQAVKQGFIVRDHAIRLLQAQIATGGIIDPVRGHRLPVEAAYKRGYFDQEMNQVLSDPENQTRSCFDPNTHENLTYLQLLRRCVPDPDTGLLMLQLMDKGSVLYQLSEDARRALQAARTTLALGLFQGQSVSVWELLFSRYVPEQRREELLRRYKAGTVTALQMIELLTAAVTGAERGRGALCSPAAQPDGKARASAPAQDTPAQEQQLRKSLKSATVRVTAGELRGQKVSVLDLLFSEHVPQGKRQELLELYRAGVLSAEQVAAVVTAVVNRTEAANARSPRGAAAAAGEDGEDCPARLDDALRASSIRVPAGELQGKQVSLWELLFSSYTPEEKRQELLELFRERLLTLEQMTAVVTALIKKKESAGRKFHITVKSSNRDPATAAREEGDKKPWERTLKTTVVRVEAGEFRGHKVSLWDLLHCRYIPEENRKELLELYKAGELTLEQVKTVVTTIVTRAAAGERPEPEAPVEGPRADPVTPVDGSRADPVTPVDGSRTEPAAPVDGSSTDPATPVHGSRADPVTPVDGSSTDPAAPDAEPSPLHRDRAWEETLKATTAEVSVGELQGRRISLWELLFSPCIPEEKRQELLELYHAGTLTLEQMTTAVTALIKKKESAGRKFHITVKSSNRDPATAAREEGDKKPWERTLKTTVVRVEAGEFRGHKVSLWDLLHCRYIPEENRKELLELYEAGELTLEQVKTVVTTIVTRAAAGERPEPEAPVEGPRADPVTPVDGSRADPVTPVDGSRAEPVTPVDGSRADPVTPVDGSRADPVTPVDGSRAEPAAPVDGSRADPVTPVDGSRADPVTPVDGSRAEPVTPVDGSRADPAAPDAEPSPLHRDRAWEETLKATTAEVSVGELQGRRISLWELLFSPCIPEEKRQELLELYRAGSLPIQELLSTTSSLASHSLEEHLRALPTHTMDLLRSEGSYITFGPSQERRVSVWELLSSKQVSEYRREACLDTYPSGGLTVNRITITTTVTTGPRLERSPRRH